MLHDNRHLMIIEKLEKAVKRITTLKSILMLFFFDRKVFLSEKKNRLKVTRCTCDVISIISSLTLNCIHSIIPRLRLINLFCMLLGGVWCRRSVSHCKKSHDVAII